MEINLLSLSHPVGLDSDLQGQIEHSEYLFLLRWLLEKSSVELPDGLTSVLNAYQKVFQTQATGAKRMALQSVISATRDAQYWSRIFNLKSDFDILSESKKHLKFWDRLTKGKQLETAVSRGNELFNSARLRLLLPEKKVIMVANMSTGKSSVINGILGFRAMKARATAATGRVTEIFEKPFADSFVSHFLNDELVLSKRDKWDDESQLKLGSENLIGVGFRYHSDEHRIRLIDTPGINSFQNLDHAAATSKYLEKNHMDAVLHLMDLTQMATDDEISALELLSKNLKDARLTVGINKVDMIQMGDESISDFIDQADAVLKQNNLSAAILPISARVTDLEFESFESGDEDDLHSFKRAEKKMKKILGTEPKGLGNLQSLVEAMI
jgi:GTP-binding protein EngB required for normal cell division